jgi:general secretion pathway protein H
MAAVSRSARAQRGFTLLELLVVMVLIAVIAGAVLLSVSGGAALRLREEAERLQQALQMAADEAVLEGSERAVYLTQGGYGFLRYDGPSHQWQPIVEARKDKYTLPDGLHLELVSDGMEVKLASDAAHAPAQTDLIFLSSGEMTPFRLSLALKSGKESAVLVTDGLAPITLHYETGP